MESFRSNSKSWTKSPPSMETKMSHKRTCWRWPWALAAIVMLYPLSMGPFMLIERELGAPLWLRPVWFLYRPLCHTCWHFDWLAETMHKYCLLWIDEGPYLDLLIFGPQYPPW